MKVVSHVVETGRWWVRRRECVSWVWRLVVDVFAICCAIGVGWLGARVP